MTVGATDSTSLYSFEGSIAAGKTLGFGAAIGVNLLWDNVYAEVAGSTIGSSSSPIGGAFTETATRTGTVVSVAAGGAGSQKVAIGGAIAVNLLENKVEAEVVGDSHSGKLHIHDRDCRRFTRTTRRRPS